MPVASRAGVKRMFSNRRSTPNVNSMSVKTPTRETSSASTWATRARATLLEDRNMRRQSEAPERMKHKAVRGFMVMKRGERLVSQGMSAAQPSKTLEATNIETIPAAKANF